MKNRKTYIPFGYANDHSLDYLNGILEDARVTTLKTVEDVLLEELHWQYDQDWNTIGVLLSHMISTEHCFRIAFLEDRSLTKEEEETYMPGLEMGRFIPQLITDEPVASYVNALEDSRTKLLEQINKLSTEEFHKRREGYNKETGCNLAWVLYHLAEDEIHHRGQISILRKLYKTTAKHNSEKEKTR